MADYPFSSFFTSVWATLQGYILLFLHIKLLADISCDMSSVIIEGGLRHCYGQININIDPKHSW